MNTTPLSLLQQLRSTPSSRSWGDFIDLYTPLLFRWANHAGLREADAADLVQEVFVVLIQKLPEFDYDTGRSFRAWLKTVLLNLWRNQARKANRAELRQAEVARPIETTGEPELDDREYREHVGCRALAMMRSEFSEPTWRACWLLVVENRTTADVARELGLSENAVYIAKSRVLTRLRQRLQGLLE